MGFGCPICSEKLDKLPAEAQGSGGSRGEINVSATPCGHIFHAYCIQKWLTGNLASSKQCPCCRKPVPHLRCLSLFPTIFDESLDDSFSQVTASSGSTGTAGSSIGSIQCNHPEIIMSLKNQIDGLQAELTDKNQMYTLLTGDFETLLEKFRTEKMASDMWMMKAKQFESYKDLADDYQRRAERAERDLTKYNQIENVIRGVEVPVNEEMTSYPPTIESIRTLIEMKHILSSDLRSVSKKFNDSKSSYETIRTEKMKLKIQYDNTLKELKELKNIYAISKVNGRVRSTSPEMGAPGLSDSTPKGFRNKRRMQEQLPSTITSSASPGVDSDIDLFPLKVKKLKQTKNKTEKEIPKKSATTKKFSCGLSPMPSASSSAATTSSQAKAAKLKLDATITLSDSSDIDDLFPVDDDDDFKIRGNVPGAPLPLAVNRIKNLQEKSQRQVLGGEPKKFKFKVNKSKQ